MWSEENSPRIASVPGNVGFWWNKIDVSIVKRFVLLL